MDVEVLLTKKKMIKKRIEGRQLAQNVGEQVIILGTIGKVRDLFNINVTIYINTITRCQ